MSLEKLTDLHVTKYFLSQLIQFEWKLVKIKIVKENIRK